MTRKVCDSVVNGVVRRSPLADVVGRNRLSADEQATAVACERPFQSHINLRLDPDDTVSLSRVGKLLGVDLPRSPNTVVSGQTFVAIWLGPDEWLLVGSRELGISMALSLRQTLNPQDAAVTEIGSGQTIIRLHGSATSDLLARGCMLDLSATAFSPGVCAQTVLARVPVLLVSIDLEPTIDLIVRRSFATYLWAWIQDAGREFGLMFTPADLS